MYNSELEKRFAAKRQEFSTRKPDDRKEMFAFHGTRREEAIATIAKDGLKVGGKEVPMAVGAIHGTGIYFCEDPSVSFGYCGDTNKMFLCEILPGKVHEGSGNLAGYDFV